MAFQRGSLTDVYDEPLIEVDEDLKQKERELKLQRKRQEFDQKIKAIGRKIIDLQNRQADPSLVEMLMTFLDAALRMKDVEDSFSAITEALGCITGAVNILDEVLETSMEMFTGSLEHKYGFWQRIKRRRQMKKAMRNQAGRMKEIVDTVNSSLAMANQMVDQTSKMAQKLAKTKKKRNKNAQPISDKTTAFLQGLRDEESGASGGSGITGVSGGGYSPSAASAAPGTENTGVDDII